MLPDDAIEGSIKDDSFEFTEIYYRKLVENVFEDDAFALDSQFMLRQSASNSKLAHKH